MANNTARSSTREAMLFAAMAVATIVWWVAIYSSSPKLALTLLVSGVLLIIVALIFSRRRRFFSAANFLIVSWLGSNSIPRLAGAYFNTESVQGFFEFGEAAHWTYNLSLPLLAGLLYLLDARVRDNVGIAIGRSLVHLSNKVSGHNSVNQNAVFNRGTINNSVINNFGVQRDFHAEIDACVAFIEGRKLDVALERLQELKRTCWEQLDKRAQFRIVTNIGAANLIRDEYSVAARCFYEAKRILPDDPKALFGEIQADLLNDKRQEACQKAKSLISLHPEYVDGWAVWVLADDSLADASVAASAIPAVVRNEASVLEALVSLAIRLGQLDFGESVSQAVLEMSPSNQMRLQCAAILLRKVTLAQVGDLTLTSESRHADLRQAMVLLDHIIGDNDEPSNQLRARARFYRAQANRLCKRKSHSEADFREAVAKLNDKEEALFQFGMFLYEHGRIDEAIEQLLEAARLNGASKQAMIAAQLLLDRGYASDTAEARRLLESALLDLEKCDAVTRFDLAEQLIRLGDLGELGGQRESLFSQLPEVEKKLLRSIELMDSDSSRSKELLMQAKSLVSSDTSEYQKFLIGHRLLEAKEFDLALEVFELCERARHGAEGTEFIVNCARKAGDAHFVASYCKRLRERGNASKYSVECEVIALQEISASETAVKVIDEYLQSDSESGFAAVLRTYRSVIGKRLGRPELVEYRAEHLPKFDEVPTYFANIVAILLCHGPQPSEGMIYAYRTLRRNFQDPEAHKCLCQIMLQDEGNSVPGQYSTVIVDSAVTYEDEDGNRDTKIIESDASPIPSLNEIPPDSHLAKKLLNLSVGDQFVLRETPLSSLQARVMSIEHKASFRARDSLENWESRFHDVPFLYKCKIPKDAEGQLDANKFIQQIEQLSEPRKRLDKLVATEPITPLVYAKHTDESVVDAILHLAGLENAPIRCVRGTSEDYHSGVRCLERNYPLVLDSSALATIFLLGFDGLLSGIDRELVVCESGLEEFRSILNNRFHRFWSELLIGWSPDGRHVLERTEEEFSKLRTRLTDFIGNLVSQCEVLPGTIGGAIARNRRREIEKVGGEALVQCIAAAESKKAAIWTDDMGVGLLASEERLSRVWTELVIDFHRQRNKIDRATADNMVLQLIDADFRFTRLTADVIRLAITASGCQADRRPLSMCIKWFGESGVHQAAAVKLSAEFVFCLHSSLYPDSLRNSGLGELIRNIGKRNDALRVLESLQFAVSKKIDTGSELYKHFERCVEVEKKRCVGDCSIVLPSRY